MRRLRRSPGFFIIAIVLIAIGIGAATTIFALVNAILLRPLAVRNPDNLVQVVQIFALGLRPQGYFSYEFYRQLSDNASTLFDIAGQSETSVALDVGAGPERAYVQLVTDNFFTALGVDAVLGSVNTSTDARMAVLSYRSLRETPPPIAYTMSFGPKMPPSAFVLYVRTRTSPAAVIGPIRKLMRSINPAIPVYDASTLSAEVQRSLWRERLVVALAASFAVFALVLSAIGLYGVLAYFVAQRRRELGIRLALGAAATHVTWTVVRCIGAALIAGSIAGIGIYAIASRWLRSLLFGVNFTDPLILGGSLLLVLMMAGAAAGVPIYRALLIDPASTLKSE